MTTRMIEVNAEFVIAALESRYEDVKELWGCQASHDLWEQALSLVEDAGLGSCSSPSAYVDNYLINGEFTSKKNDSGYWIAETSLDGQILALIDQMHNEADQNEIDNLRELISDLIAEAWNEYCQDNALIYNDQYACLQF